MLRTIGQINPKKYRSTLIRVMEILAFISVNEKVNYTKIVTHCNVSNKLLSRIRTKLLKLGYIIHTKNLGDGTRSENYLTITNSGIAFLNHFNQMKNSSGIGSEDLHHMVTEGGFVPEFQLIDRFKAQGR